MKRGMIFVASALMLTHAFAAQLGTEPRQAQHDAQLELQARDALDRQVAMALAPVKNLADFYARLNDGSKGMAAFARLPAAAQQAFISSLTFNETGLTSFNYQVLEDSLRVEEAYSLLSLFGAQSTVRLMRGLKAQSTTDFLIRQAVSRQKLPPSSTSPNLKAGGGGEEDHKEYECIRPHTCQSSGGRICMSGC